MSENILWVALIIGLIITIIVVKRILASSAKKAGAAFLEQNKSAEGVIALENGLQYQKLTTGSGQKPNNSDTVVVHYEGKLIDGTVFDSSYIRKQPMTFSLAQVIRGWQEIIPMMPTGSKWKIFVPSDLAYGTRGAGAAIGPNETLIFEIELLEIE